MDHGSQRSTRHAHGEYMDRARAQACMNVAWQQEARAAAVALPAGREAAGAVRIRSIDDSRVLRGAAPPTPQSGGIPFV